MSLRTLNQITLLSAALALLPSLAQAQRLPRRDGFSFWGSAGYLDPSERSFDSTVGFNGGLDYFLTRAFSVGATVGFWKADTSFGSNAKLGYLDFVGTYNWEGGRFHPFIQGGVGTYRTDYPFASAKTKFGGFAAGGMDLFLTRSAAFDVAFRYHFVPETAGFDGNFFEALAGVKFYF